MSRTAAPHRQVTAAVIGNALEWYDFVVFGFLATVIARLFFPNENEYAALLLTLATFGAGFFTRPVGAVVLGVYADRRGRKAALRLIITLMTLATAMIAFAPTYASIGIAAPIIMLFGRLLQGFATGGEFASATSFLVEVAPEHQRGLYGSFQMLGQGIAALAGATAGFFVTRALTPEQLDAWGWRLPFLFGLLIAPVGMWMRRTLTETDAFLHHRSVSHSARSITHTLRAHTRNILVSFGLVTSGTIAYYVVLIHMPTFARNSLKIALPDAFLAQLIGLVCLCVSIVMSGWLSDRIRRKRIMVFAMLSLALLLYPSFRFLHGNPTVANLVGVQAMLCVVIGAAYGPISAVLAEQFSVGVRSTGLAIAYNFAVMMFGGFAPFVVTWLVNMLDSPVAAAYYVIAGAMVGLTAAFFLKSETVRT